MTELEKALQLKSQLDSLRPISIEQEAVIMQKLRLDWNYNSNHIEGNTLSFGETKALILFGLTASGKPLRDHFEIIGHDTAIRWVIDIVKGEYPITESFIRELHSLLLKEPYEVAAITADGLKTTKRVEVGKYKSSPNHVLTKTGEVFRFALPEETAHLMNDLMDWYKIRDEKQDVNPIIVASEFHYRFIRIHPFDDGNGRTARILMNFILMRNGFPPAIIKADDKENYYNELRLADSGMIEPFIEYIARNLISSLNIMIAGAKGENIEEPNDLDKEIALIQNRLISLKKSGKVISEESILTVYSNICKKIILFFYDSFSKFDAFYKFHQLRLQLDNATEVGGRETVEKMEEHVTQNAKTLTCTYLFSEFRDAALSINNFNPFFFVTFDKDSIEIRSGIIGVDRFEGQAKLLKFYDENISDDEIRMIVNPLINYHTNLLDNGLKYLENFDKSPMLTSDFLVGTWLNEWDVKGSNPGSETVQIKGNGEYIRNNEHIFNVENFKYDRETNKVSFYKKSIRQGDDRKLKDVLTVATSDFLVGTEESYAIQYTRIKQ